MIPVKGVQEGWRSITTDAGEPFVMTVSLTSMLRSFAGKFTSSWYILSHLTDFFLVMSFDEFYDDC